MAAGTEVIQPANASGGACLRQKHIVEGEMQGTADHRINHGTDIMTCTALPTPSLLPIIINPSGLPHDQHEMVRNSSILEFKPAIRSGVWYDIGARRTMEDEHVLIDDLVEHYGHMISGQGSVSYYGVFDGHGGKKAAEFVKERLLKFIVEDAAFPNAVQEAVQHAFLQTDTAFEQACSVDQDLSSGTTALAVLVLERKVFVANAGDCRAVLCRKGRAIDMSRDHKASCNVEKRRIEALGGFVYDGYLNGQLSVARALGNWHLEGLKGANCPLSAEPEVKEAFLTEDDEFMILGCDGLWDVFSSQNAVDFARGKLKQHNDPEKCSRELVDEALRRNTCDNTTVITVCFQRLPPPKVITKFIRKCISPEGIRSVQGVLDTVL